MKKKILIVLLIAVLMLCGKDVCAADGYCNLIDVNKIEYNSSSGKFYSGQKINLSKGVNYTFVASENFFGSSNSVVNKYVGVNSTGCTISFKLALSNSGLYYATVSPTETCTMEITDFLVKGHDLNTLPKDEVILYKGTKTDFKGFRKPEYIENYVKADKSLDIYTSCSNPVKVEDITKKLKSYDNESGFYNGVTLISDNYKNNSALGNYTLTYKAVDKANNATTLTVNVKVVDNEGPVITGPDVVEWDCYTTDPVPENVFQYYKVYDNVDGDITRNLKTQTLIIFIYEMGVAKDYEFILAATDNAGNKTLRTITIRAYDMLPPELELKDINIKLSELGKSSFSSFFEQTVVSVSDYSEKYTLEYGLKEVTGKMGFSGTFQLSVTASDPTGNKTVKTANIKVLDDIAPEIYIQTELLNTTTENVYTLDDIKNIISDNLYNEGILYDSIDLISCNYISNEKNPGKYEVKYAYTYKDVTNYVIGTINVTKVEEPKSPVIFLLIVGTPLVIGIIYAIKRKNDLY